MRMLVFSMLVATAACTNAKSKLDPMLAPEATVPTITVDELDQKLAAGELQAVDANGPGTRQKLGVIPGAVLLSDYEAFLPSELPADKSKGLVFYCANQQCGASHEAAEKAITAGYRNVRVLPAGIAGWRQAGKPTQQVGT